MFLLQSLSLQLLIELEFLLTNDVEAALAPPRTYRHYITLHYSIFNCFPKFIGSSRKTEHLNFSARQRTDVITNRNVGTVACWVIVIKLDSRDVSTACGVGRVVVGTEVGWVPSKTKEIKVLNMLHYLSFIKDYLERLARCAARHGMPGVLGLEKLERGV